jgi:hypothetical protein
MELTPAQRKLTFALIVVVLAALAVYLFVSRGSGTGSAPAAAHPATHRAAPPAPATQTPAATSAPPASDVTQNSSIWQLVPFTPQGLTSAETVAVRFGAAYGTYSYTESTAAYVATMKSYISNGLSQQIAAAYSTPGVASQRSSEKQVASATARVTALRDFGSSSLTFLLQVSQQVTATKGGGPTSSSYAVTLTGGDTTWQVTGIELSTVGQF